MTKRGWALTILAGLAAALAAVVVAIVVVAVAAPDPSCADKLKADEAKVRTSRWEPAEDLPGLGQYVEIHWQARALGDPCSRAPGPTDWTYQGVVRLRPADARSLAGRYEWQPVVAASSSAADVMRVWPALSPFVASDVRWLHNDSYDEMPPQVRWRRLYLDPDRALALFVLNDR
ncbi:MAG TPA: hypothetical protein VFT95_07010 [Micromonosporaceae bacterium]|nr:hypothetical protein [Micromonosporaceae bacterium]